MIKTTNANAPEWKPITVQSKMPGALAKLDEMAHNMWWTWNTDAYNLYHDIAPDRFKATNHNVIEMLGSLSYEDLTTLSQDAAFLARMDKVYQHFRTYMDEKPDATRPSVAYFCMEYGLYHFLRIYSGGLGILAGDYLKQASDSNVDLTAVGLLYRYGYFTQELAMDGSQIAKYEAQDFERLPINKVMTPEGRQMVLEVPFPGYTLYAQVWRVDVGRVKLYLLDTDIPQNSEFDRPITHTLYGGDWENRLKQEVLLGIAKLSRVGSEAEGQKAEVVLSLHLPAHFLAATGLDGHHRYRGVGNNHINGLHRSRIKDFEFRLGRDRLVARVDDVGHEPQLVVVVHVTRHVGHDHHGLRRGEGVFVLARLAVFGVGHQHQAPAREGVGHREAEGRATVLVGA